MKRPVLCGILLALLGAAVFGDSIDDAEAKRRGVPVAQVVAERKAAAEKARGAATRAAGSVTSTRQAAATQGAPGAVYTFSLNRKTVLGPYDTHVTIERTYVTTLTVPGRPPAIKNYSLKADLTGRVFVNKVENGEAVDLMIEVKKFEIGGKEEYKAGDPLYLQREGGRVFVLSPDGASGCPPDELLKAVEIMFDGLGENPAHEDEIFGTKGPHTVGAQWVVGSASLMPEVMRLTSTQIDPAQLKAKANVVGVEDGTDGEMVRMNVGFEATGFTDDPPDAGYQLSSSIMRGTYGRAVKTKGGAVVENSFSYDITINEAAASGEKYQCKVHQVRNAVSTPVPREGK